MKKPYFIMMYNQSGETAMPIVEENDDIKFFASEKLARECAEQHEFCKHFGYEILDMENGL